MRAWAEKYRDQGLVVIGVHAPEFAFEKDLDNVCKAVSDYGVTYPVAVDNDFAIWRDFGNHYWPAHYFVDATGQIRFHHFGEGNYDESERVIQRLLGPADGRPVRFRVTSDGRAPGDQHGVDIDANGDGVVTSQRLYQLIRQNGVAEDRVFEIRFIDRGVEADAFTFG